MRWLSVAEASDGPAEPHTLRRKRIPKRQPVFGRQAVDTEPIEWRITSSIIRAFITCFPSMMGFGALLHSCRPAAFYPIRHRLEERSMIRIDPGRVRRVNDWIDWLARFPTQPGRGPFWLMSLLDAAMHLGGRLRPSSVGKSCILRWEPTMRIEFGEYSERCFALPRLR